MLNTLTLQDHWQHTMQSMGFNKHIDCCQQLLSAYNQTHRHYHDTKHLAMCLQILEQIPFNDLPSQKLRSEIALALWFHDSVYHTQALDGEMIDNETKSAEWAYDFIIQASQNEALAQRIKQAIIATKHNIQYSVNFAAEDLQAWVLDIDLAILGTKTRHYDQFEKLIRQEYAWVPWQKFYHARLSVLQSFLQSPHIYHTHYFHQRYEALARENLQRQIDLFISN